MSDIERVKSQEGQVEGDKSRVKSWDGWVKVKSYMSRVMREEWHVKSNMSMKRLTNEVLDIKTNIPRLSCQDKYIKIDV